MMRDLYAKKISDSLGWIAVWLFCIAVNTCGTAGVVERAVTKSLGAIDA